MYVHKHSKVHFHHSPELVFVLACFTLNGDIEKFMGIYRKLLTMTWMGTLGKTTTPAEALQIFSTF